MRLCALVAVCGLLYSVSGQDTSTTIEIKSATNTASEGGVLNAKLDEEVSVKCVFDPPPAFNTPVSLKYKKNADSNIQEIFTIGGDLQEPWNSRKEDYEREYGSGAPFIMTFKIKNVGTQDTGAYICSMKELTSGNILASSESSISVAANVEKVEIVGSVDGKYKVTDESRQTTVICKAYNGSEPSTMQFRISGLEDPLPVDKVSTSYEGDIIEYTGTIYHKFTAEDNDKQLTCEVIVPGYESEKVFARTNLEVAASPIINCPDEVQGNLKGTVTVACTVSGQPKPDRSSLEWTVEKNGLSIKADQKSASLGLDSKIAEDGIVYNIELRITVLNSGSFGRYFLSAKNAGGYREVPVRLKKKVAQVGDGGGGATSLSVYSSLLLLLLGCLLIV